MDNKIKICRVTSTRPNTLTKRFWLDSGKTLQKDVSANLCEGTAEQCEIQGLTGFAKLLCSLKHNQALCYGLTGRAKVKLTTKSKLSEMGDPPDTIARTKHHFSWGTGPRIMMLDYDPEPGHQPLTKPELLERLYSACPKLSNAGLVWWVSSSSYIYHDKVELQGLRGQRLYMLVENAADIPRAGKALTDHLWLNDAGSIVISKAGQMLERCLFDASVWQAERLDFAAGAKCEKPLIQKRPEPEVIAGEMVDTSSAIPALTPEEQAKVEALKKQARAESLERAREVKSQYINSRAQTECGEDADEATLEQARQTITRALDNDTLCGDFKLTLDSGEVVTVGEMLDNPARYHKAKTKDPMEPDYQNNKTVGEVYLFGGRPRLHSFAHGSKTYRLIRQPQRIELIKGQTRKAVDDTLALMRQLPDVYDLGQALVRVQDGTVIPMEDISGLGYWLGGSVQYWAWCGRSKKPEEVLRDPPDPLLKQLLSLKDGRGLKKLDALVTTPVVRLDGSIANRPGYDEKTRLYLDIDGDFPRVPEKPTVGQVKSAYEVLMKPFQNFPFCTALDRSIFVSALLTAIQRPVLPTAPGFGFDAPVAGSGKTLLARCIGALMTREDPPVWPHVDDEGETRKRLMALLSSGGRCLVWDNVIGFFDSAAIAGFLTGSVYADRKLGATAQITLPNRAGFLLTGNNLVLTNDMARRILKCRIDPQTERPYAREFRLCPLQYILKHRPVMAAAALTIIKAWYVEQNRASAKLASFEDWDTCVRQPVAWLGRTLYKDQLDDPMARVDEAQESDPEKESMTDLLMELFNIFGSRPFKASDLSRHLKTTEYSASPLGDAWEGLGVPQITPKAIGRALRFRIDRQINGYVLRKAPQDKHNKVQQWRVERVNNHQSQAA